MGGRWARGHPPRGESGRRSCGVGRREVSVHGAHEAPVVPWCVGEAAPEMEGCPSAEGEGA